jgi:hypothetical protein
MSEKTFCVVCTEKRGVFAGMVEDQSADPMTITEAQMCVYWDADTRGVVGLAAKGPTSGCRITDVAPSITVNGITAVMVTSEDAKKAWRSCPWG